jgi:hypothetical protein
MISGPQGSRAPTLPRVQAAMCTSTFICPQFAAALVAILSYTAASPVGASPLRGRTAPAAITTFEQVRHFDANRINMFVTNFGSIAWDLTSGSSGLIYPKGTGQTAVYAAGLWLGGTVGAQTRLAVAEYSQEYAPGVITPGGFPDDPMLARYRVYKVAAWKGSASDTAHVNRSAAELAADPHLDPLAHDSWSEYMAGAVPSGAPWRLWRLPKPGVPGDSVDVPGPEVPGDQMLWCVFNDADPGVHIAQAGSTGPLGIEVQQSVFGFDRSDALGDVVFVRERIINKGANTIQNAYVSLWSDVDLGTFTDDQAGCDTTGGVGFVYNATDVDGVYGAHPPAVGVAMLRGPLHAPGQALGMTSFVRYVNGTDPNSAAGTYNSMRGLLADGSAIVNPLTGAATTFMFTGNPFVGTGWLDPSASDKRMLVSSGAFTLAPGDTQVVIGAIVLGRAADHISSIGQVECGAALARQTADRAFVPPSPPPAPTCPVAVTCPRPASFWFNQCQLGGAGALSGPQLDAIASCVDAGSTIFNWGPGAQRSQFCAVVNPYVAGDVRQQAKRELATLLANTCARPSSIVPATGDPIFLNPILGIACPGLQAATIQQLTQPPGTIGLWNAEYLDNNTAHSQALFGVDWHGEGFRGGAGTAFHFLGSSLNPVTQPDSFVSVELRFQRAFGQHAYRFLRYERASDGEAPPQGRVFRYGGFWNVPFTAWDVVNNRQLDVAFVERLLTDDFGTILPPAQQPATFDSTWQPDASFQGGHEYVIVFQRPYTGTPNPAIATSGSINGSSLPALYALWSQLRLGGVIDDWDAFRFSWGSAPTPGLDGVFASLETQPLSDPTVSGAYRDIVNCLSTLNGGGGLGSLCTSPVPVAVMSISATAAPDVVLLRWGTSAGTPRGVERRTAALEWEVVGRAVPSAGSLMFEDHHLVPGERYGYRLAGDGVHPAEGETWVEVPVARDVRLLGLVPNPGPATGAVRFWLPYRADVTLDVLDVSGRRVAHEHVGELPGGSFARSLPGAGRLGPGVYVVRVGAGGHTASRRVVLIE